MWFVLSQIHMLLVSGKGRLEHPSFEWTLKQNGASCDCPDGVYPFPLPARDSDPSLFIMAVSLRKTLKN